MLMWPTGNMSYTPLIYMLHLCWSSHSIGLNRLKQVTVWLCDGDVHQLHSQDTAAGVWSYHLCVHKEEGDVLVLKAGLQHDAFNILSPLCLPVVLWQLDLETLIFWSGDETHCESRATQDVYLFMISLYILLSAAWRPAGIYFHCKL